MSGRGRSAEGDGDGDIVALADVAQVKTVSLDGFVHTGRAEKLDGHGVALGVVLDAADQLRRGAAHENGLCSEFRQTTGLRDAA